MPVTLHCALAAADVPPRHRAVVPEYWNAGTFTRERVAGALAGSPVFVGARVDGRLVACARAISDGHKYAWVYDVVVAPEWRGGGLGEAVMRLCLDHPRVRGAARVLLQTRDAQPLYRKLGFIDVAEAAAPTVPSTSMLRTRGDDSWRSRSTVTASQSAPTPSPSSSPSRRRASPTRSRRCRWRTRSTTASEYRDPSVTGRVPAIDPRRLLAAESAAIVDYLDDVFPAPQYTRALPEGPRAARSRAW